MADRKALARQSLSGTSIGDAFGDSFFGETDAMLQHITDRIVPESRWEFTDDTVMSIAVLEQLENGGSIEQDALMRQFITNEKLDKNRGYGATVRRILRETDQGGNWKYLASAAFDGMGSMGNGAAMRELNWRLLV
ncbi:MAG: hypothetical protein Roseis2KO_32130 [Roseivirga sp.]